MNSSDLAILVDRFMRRIHFGLQARASQFDTQSVGQSGGIILITLADLGECTLTDLTTKVARDKSQMTRAIRGLEDKGLVMRKSNPSDARATLVSLTPEGEGVVQEIMQAVGTVIDEILEPITGAEKDHLRMLLERALATST